MRTPSAIIAGGNHLFLDHHKGAMSMLNTNVTQRAPDPVQEHHAAEDSKRTRQQPGSAQLLAQAQGLPQTTGHTSVRSRSDAAANARLTNLLEFEETAGSSTPNFKKKELRHRLKVVVHQRSRDSRDPRRRQLTPIRLNPEEDDEPVLIAASNTVDKMMMSGRDVLERELDNEYDPLQRYALLHNAMCEVDKKDLPQAKKEELKTEFNGMLDDLMHKHRDEIRKGLKDAQELEAAMQAMAGGTDMHPASLRELRFLYGAKGTGELDSPLSPLAMARALQQKFGAENFSSALYSLRTKMATEFRADDRKDMNPRLWLCMSDAAAFNSVQSTFAIATDLRRNLIERAQVMPRTSHASMSVSLLGIVESGKSKVSPFVTQIFDAKDADAATKGRVYAQIQHAIRELPTTMWPHDKPSQRMDVLDELGKNIKGAYKIMPALETSAEIREKEWRIALGAEKLSRADLQRKGCRRRDGRMDLCTDCTDPACGQGVADHHVAT
jgi:hypothetical protein